MVHRGISRHSARRGNRGFPGDSSAVCRGPFGRAAPDPRKRRPAALLPRAAGRRARRPRAANVRCADGGRTGVASPECARRPARRGSQPRPGARCAPWKPGPNPAIAARHVRLVASDRHRGLDRAGDRAEHLVNHGVASARPHRHGDVGLNPDRRQVTAKMRYHASISRDIYCICAHLRHGRPHRLEVFNAGVCNVGALAAAHRRRPAPARTGRTSAATESRGVRDELRTATRRAGFVAATTGAVARRSRTSAGLPDGAPDRGAPPANSDI